MASGMDRVTNVKVTPPQDRGPVKTEAMKKLDNQSDAAEGPKSLGEKFYPTKKA